MFWSATNYIFLLSTCVGEKCPSQKSNLGPLGFQSKAPPIELFGHWLSKPNDPGLTLVGTLFTKKLVIKPESPG